MHAVRGGNVTYELRQDIVATISDALVRKTTIEATQIVD
jgi:hypothetical protein